MIKKGSYVQIKNVVLEATERTANIPDDTKSVPLIMYVKGFCLEDCEIGQNVKIETVTGRIEEGIITTDSPRFDHDYGDFIPEIIEIDRMVKKALFGGDELES